MGFSEAGSRQEQGEFVLSSHEKKTATIGFLRDITKKKMGERALWRSQRLASIGRLAAEIAHEINNPLTSVITFSKLLKSIMQQEPLPAHRLNELRNYISYLQNETERCANISRNLLDFSRQTRIDVRENDINAILGKTLTILKHRAGLDKIEIVPSMLQNFLRYHVISVACNRHSSTFCGMQLKQCRKVEC